MKHKTLTVKEIITINRIMMVASSVFTTIMSVCIYNTIVKDVGSNILTAILVALVVPIGIVWVMSGIINHMAIDQYNKQLIEESNEFAEAIIHGKITTPDKVEYLLKKIDEYNKANQQDTDDNE